MIFHLDPVMDWYLAIFFITLVTGLLGYTALLDFLYYRVPNKIFFTLFYLFPLWIVLSGRVDLLKSYSLFLIFLVTTFILFALRIIGGGDAKLLSVTGLWIGWSGWYWLVITMSLVGGILCLGFMTMPQLVIALSSKIRNFLDSIPMIKRLHQYLIPEFSELEQKTVEMQNKKIIPYGVAIAIGGITALWTQ
jgi:prepilin peptidase CpaA